METVNPRATIIRVVEESKPGKRAAMYTGLAYVDTEITVFADDDALYGPAVLKSLIMPFKDPAMGGCGTRQIARPKADKFCFSDIMMVGFMEVIFSCLVWYDMILHIVLLNSKERRRQPPPSFMLCPTCLLEYLKPLDNFLTIFCFFYTSTRGYSRA